MKRLIITIFIVLACLICPAFGQQAGVNSAGMFYSQQYRLWGFEMYDEDYVHPGIVAEVEGVEVSAVTHLKDWDEDVDDNWDIRTSYKIPVGGLYVRPGYGYFMLPGDLEVQEASITVGLAGEVAPRYTFAHVIPDEADEGQLHIIGLDLLLGDPNNIRALVSAEICYNDGVNPLGGPVISDWSHTNLGAQVIVPVAGFEVVPGVVWQHTLEEAVDADENEVWATLSLVKRF